MTDRILPQLASPLDDPSLIKKYLQAPHWWASEKIDGERILIEIIGGICAYNRQGVDIKTPNPILKDLARVDWETEWVLDGELLDNKLWVFDLCRAKSKSLLGLPYKKRHAELERLLDWWQPENIRVIPVARDETEKIDLLRYCREHHAEGVMFKNTHGLYQPQTRSKDWYKLKFVTTADVIVSEIGPDGKAAVRMSVYDPSGNEVPCGGCAVRGDMLRHLRVGSVITVRYRKVSQDGKLVEPAFMMARDDKTAEECTSDQFSYTPKTVVTA